MKRKTFHSQPQPQPQPQPQLQKQAKRKKPSIVRLPTNPNIAKEEVLQRMREKDVPLKQNKKLQVIKRTANIYNLFAHLFSRLECEDYKDVEDAVIFFKADYMLDNVLLKLECDVAAVQQYCCVCFILQWKYERVEIASDYYDVAIVLKTFDESFDDVGVDELTKILIRREIEALNAVQYRVEQVTAYDFVLTFLCTRGCLYFGESDSKFKKEVKQKLEQLLKHNSTRLMKAEKIANLLIWFVRKQYFYLPLEQSNMEEFYKTIKV